MDTAADSKPSLACEFEWILNKEVKVRLVSTEKKQDGVLLLFSERVRQSQFNQTAYLRIIKNHIHSITSMTIYSPTPSQDLLLDAMQKYSGWSPDHIVSVCIQHHHFNG